MVLVGMCTVSMSDHWLEFKLVQEAFEACVQGISGLPHSRHIGSSATSHIFLSEIPQSVSCQKGRDFVDQQSHHVGSTATSHRLGQATKSYQEAK